MKKHLTKILFTLMMIIGFSLTASAQQQDKDKKPRRDPPEIVVPKPPKPPKEDKKEDKKPKPEMFSKFIIINDRSDLS